MLDGKIWKPWGVNYMPSSGAGNDKEYFNNYLADYSYDPVVVERDFQKLGEIGFNSVNIFVFTGYAEDLNLIDMLRLADKYGFKAVLSLRPGTPFDTVSESAETLIPLLRLLIGLLLGLLRLLRAAGRAEGRAVGDLRTAIVTKHPDPSFHFSLLFRGLVGIVNLL